MGRPVSFDFASGGGSTAEFLMGEVEIEPTLMHNVGTRIVLPDTVALPLVNGKAVHPDMAISPDGPEPAWAYKVTVRSGMTGRVWSEFRGVPTGTTQIAYKDLTKFVTTIPPQTTAGMMQNWADTTEANADRSELAADRAEAPTDLMNKNLIENPASLTAGALSAAIVDKVTDDKLLLKPSGDTRSGFLNWQNDAQAGYLLHLTTGPNSTSGAAAVAIGTETGSGTGLLVSHKNLGTAVLIGLQPGTGPGIDISARSTSTPLFMRINSGAGAPTIAATASEAFFDGVVNTGSTTLTSMSANFTAADVGRAIYQLTSTPESVLIGGIPAGTTIASVESESSVTLSVPAGRTGTGLRFQINDRQPAYTQNLFRILDSDYVTPIVEVKRGGTIFNAPDPGTVPLKIDAKSGHASNAFEVWLRGVAGSLPVFSVTSLGRASSVAGADVTNAANPASAPFIASTYGSQPVARFRSLNGATGDNVHFQGGDTSSYKSRVDKNGYIMTKINTAPNVADVGEGEAAIWFDAAASQFKVSAKVGGVLKTGSVTLA